MTLNIFFPHGQLFSLEEPAKSHKARCISLKSTLYAEHNAGIATYSSNKMDLATSIREEAHSTTSK